MTDKEVGELWPWVIGKEPNGEIHTFTIKEMTDVLHKLIEARAKSYLIFSGNSLTVTESITMACEDYGLPCDGFVGHE